jgi:hypothetical protein
LFNIGPKALASYNHLDMEKPLIIGQEVGIPLTTANFAQTAQKVPGETLVPVYHLVGEKEWMYRVSVNHNKVPIGSLEKWNHITKDQVKAGMYLVVGFLKVKTALSAYAKQAPPAPASHAAPENAVAATSQAFAPATGVGKSSSSPIDQRSDTSPMMINRPLAAKKAMPETGQISSFAEKNKTGDGIAKTDDGTSKSSDGALGKTGKKTDALSRINFNGGHFRSDFSEGTKTANGIAGIFKSASGWQDGKYYALMNNIAVGTIVKINIPSTGRAVYAKVLGPLPDMKESAGLVIRISNAAAAELGADDSRFGVEVRY